MVESLMESVASFPNLLLAFKKASLGKTKREAVLRYSYGMEPNLFGLREKLLDGTWRPGPYHSFTVRDPKERLIQVAPFEDRVVHHAICNVIEPIFDKAFIEDSYACRRGKGTHKAMLRLKAFLRKCRRQNPGRETYALKCDVRKYFPSIDHAILFSILSKRIDDPRLLAILSKIIDSTPGRAGIPIGNLTSQLFANIYLNELDRFAKHTLLAKYHLRYMDDFVILSPDKYELHGFKRMIGDFLKEKLALDLHPRKTNIFPARDGVDFVGYRVFADFVLLRKSQVKRLLARLKNLDGARLDESLKSFGAHAKWADSCRLRTAVALRFGQGPSTETF